MDSTKAIHEPKPAKTYEEQLRILQSRGLYADNEESAINQLAILNYYRLRGYYIHLQEKDNEHFKSGVSLAQIIAIHTFDSELRLILLKLLFDVEIITRTRIAYEIGNAWGPLGYEEEINYNGCDHDQFVKLQSSISSDLMRSKERFIKTHNEKYGGKFPIWVAVETMSFGDLSKLYSLLPPSNRSNIANAYQYLDEKLLLNWLQAASLLRNTCAHNSRIYARSFSVHALIESELKKHIEEIIDSDFALYDNSLFVYLLALRRISRSETWNAFLSNLKALFQNNAGIIEIWRMGFPRQWNRILLPK